MKQNYTNYEINREKLFIVLEELKARAGVGYELQLEYRPGEKPGLHGEIIDERIIVYDEDLTTACETVVHEYVEYLVSQVNLPYKLAFIKLCEEEAGKSRRRSRVLELARKVAESAEYSHKEVIVNALTHLILEFWSELAECRFLLSRGGRE